MRSLCLMLCTALAALNGCSNAKEGAVSGGAVGALSGLAIGSLSGEAGKGAAIGAVAGVVGGAVIGDQNERRANEARQARAQSPQPTYVTVAQPVDRPAYATGAALGKLVGNWTVRGTIRGGDGASTSIPVSGTSQSVVDKTYFVRIDLHIKDPRSGQTVDGTSVISQTGGRNLELTNAYSSSPETKRFRGAMDESGNVFTFAQYEPPTPQQRIVIRVAQGGGWTADVWRDGERTEALTFEPTRP